ncbi:MAG: hypothetical protein U9Q80_06215 [Bacillota bacterium]|nr:hypothetical protein [Bacillota bacterium]
MRIIVGIQVNHRSGDAVKVQEILTKYGCIIKSRLGLHDAGDGCSDEGLILLELIERKDKVAAEYLEEEINALENVKIKRMNF